MIRLNFDVAGDFFARKEHIKGMGRNFKNSQNLGAYGAFFFTSFGMTDIRNNMFDKFPNFFISQIDSFWPSF